MDSLRPDTSRPEVETNRFLTMAEASAHVGGVPSAETFYRLARDGHLPVKRIGRRLVISSRRLDEWMDQAGDARSVFYGGVALDRSLS